MTLAEYILDHGEFAGETFQGLYPIYIQVITKPEPLTEIRRYATLWIGLAPNTIHLVKLDFIEEVWMTSGDRINIYQTIVVDYGVDQVPDEYKRYKIVEDADGVVYEHESVAVDSNKNQSEYDRLLNFFLKTIERSAPKSKYAPDV